MAPDLPPPQNSHEAAEQVDAIKKRRRKHVEHWRKASRIHEQARRMHKRELRVATLIHRAVTPVAVRESEVGAHPLSDDVKAQACVLLEALDLDPSKVGPPECVDDLEYIRGLAESEEDRARQEVRDIGDERRQWLSVASMSREEAGFIRAGGDT